MTPHVVFQRRDIEIADQNHALRSVAAQLRASTHFVEKGELVREFGIAYRIRRIAAGGYIEIMQCNGIAQPGALAEHR